MLKRLAARSRWLVASGIAAAVATALLSTGLLVSTAEPLTRLRTAGDRAIAAAAATAALDLAAQGYVSRPFLTRSAFVPLSFPRCSFAPCVQRQQRNGAPGRLWQRIAYCGLRSIAPLPVG